MACPYRHSIINALSKSAWEVQCIGIEKCPLQVCVKGTPSAMFVYPRLRIAFASVVEVGGGYGIEICIRDEYHYHHHHHRCFETIQVLVF